MHDFPLERLKKFPVLACYRILFMNMANHGMSKVVTAFRGISCDRGVVTQKQT
jgi:hypothetical protein